MIFRYDYVLSIWIFVWFLLFITGIIKVNPILILFIASIIDSIAIIYKIYYKESYNNIYKFFIIQCFIKYIPLFLVWKIDKKIFTKQNIKHTLIFICIYMMYMYINVGSIQEILKIYDKMLKTTISQNKEDQYPLTALWNNLEKHT